MRDGREIPTGRYTPSFIRAKQKIRCTAINGSAFLQPRGARRPARQMGWELYGVVVVVVVVAVVVLLLLL